MGTKKRVESFLGISPAMGERQRGQILVLVAISMVGLLVATGLAVDGGFLMLRKSQFDRAVDAAALTGVPVISATDPTSLATANTRGRQLLAANGIVIPDALSLDNAQCPANGVLPEDNPATPAINEQRDYCGQILSGSIPGAVRYRIIVRWNVPMYFMPLIQINNVPLVSDAMAEYYPVVDMYASDIGEQGLVKSAMLSTFGPDSCTGYGDAYVPRRRQDGAHSPSSWYDELNGVYTYRVAIPGTYAFDQVRIELFDPDSYNVDNPPDPPGPTGPSVTWYQYVNNIPRTRTSFNGRENALSWSTTTTGPAVTTPENPNWFYRVDELRGPLCSSGTDYTRTYYRLFYYAQTTAGNLQEVDLAYYVSDGTSAEAQATDMMWVAPGAPCPTGNTADADCERMPAFTHTGPVWSSPATPGTPTTPPSSLEEPATTTSVSQCNTLRQTASPSGIGTLGNPAVGCQGDGNFIINVSGASSEVPNIYQDPNTVDLITGRGTRHIYLQVIPFDGSSENVFALWAGPSRLNGVSGVDQYAPAEINARQIFLLRKAAQATPQKWHRSRGLVVYGVGHMTLNWEASDRVRFPLASLDSTFSGQRLNVEVFDTNEAESSDTQASPIYFYLDSINTQDWSACFTDKADSDCTDADPLTDPNPIHPGSPAWTMSVFKCTVPADPVYGTAFDPDGGDCLGVGTSNHVSMADKWGRFTFVLPSELDPDPTHRVLFVPGRLYVSYKGSLEETNSWKMTVEGRPVLVG